MQKIFQNKKIDPVPNVQGLKRKDYIYNLLSELTGMKTKGKEFFQKTYILCTFFLRRLLLRKKIINKILPFDEASQKKHRKTKKKWFCDARLERKRIYLRTKLISIRLRTIEIQS